MRMVGLDRLACIGLLLLAAAAPAEQGQAPPPSAAKAKHAQHRPPHHTRQPLASRATRPEAPVATAPGFTPAPVPDLAKTAPVSPVESRTHAEPTLFDLGNKYQGDGYIYGSSPQGMDDRRAAKVPGVEVKVPLK